MRYAFHPPPFTTTLPLLQAPFHAESARLNAENIVYTIPFHEYART
jgi:hypothetical protein